MKFLESQSIIRDRIAMLARQGKTLEQIKAMRPTLDYDGNYGSTTGPWTTDMFIDAVFKEVTPKPAAAPTPAGKKPAAKAGN